MRGVWLHIIGLVATLAVGVALWPRQAPVPLSAPAQDAELLVKHRQPTTPQQRLRARLMIPVEGVTRSELQDTWGDARSEGRTHQGIDIIAPQGTRVQAVADGRIVKFFDSVRGGITIYQFDQTERFVYYYGHLSARAAGLLEGDQVRQGATIGYVGMTGNAPVPHLHFEIQRLRGTERRWWQADSMNPYPYLMTGVPPT
ncbi:Glycyl-glycine endopeptidase ALE-1 precursor [Terricaulis silvestris]|uniref:Glycyl-glycine endopeptidase ALE-1 n=1 Tax=Terricaulis silvestris TaxID=2686094 RepID=A0A6I6MI79_9CAUL|nr:Glycyl-glycine endopeptidase ALE-1 precursor [Terricaulis silvestris]